MPTASNSIRRARPLLGTFVDVEVTGEARAQMERAVEAAFNAVARVHDLMSFHEPESEVAHLNRCASAEPVRVHPWTLQVLRTAMDLHRRSRGAFDVTVAPVLQAMNVLPRHGHERSSATKEVVMGGAVQLMADGRVRFTDRATRIDLGGIAKGFAVDRAIDVLRCHRITSALVNAGGDLAAFGPHPFKIHIRDGRDPRALLCRIDVKNAALASSASYFDPFRSSEPLGPAIIDPRRRRAVRGIASATVRAPCCMIADALTKILMVRGSPAEPLLDHYRAEAVVVFSDGAVQMTRGFESTVHRAA